jgi:hypothetical protein
MLGECEADLENYFRLTSMMLRIGAKLGLRRRGGKEIVQKHALVKDAKQQSFASMAAVEFERVGGAAARP